MEADAKLRAASSFNNVYQAQRALLTALRQDQTGLNNWMNSGDPLPYYLKYESNRPIGVVLYRGAISPVDAHRATFVIRRVPDHARGTAEGDVYVHTMFLDAK
jgi:hypothetical protein